MPTRWNSTHNMLKRIVESRTVLADLAQKNYKTSSGTFCLPDLAYNELSKVVTALQPAADFTNELSNRKACLSLVLPVYEQLKNLAKNQDFDVATSVQQDIAKALEKRMEQAKDKEKSLV